MATVGKTDGLVTAISAATTIVSVASAAFRASVTVSVVALSGTIGFLRSGTHSSEVLTFSAADRTLRSLPRNAQFPLLGAPTWSADGTLLVVEVIHGYAYSPDDEWTDYFSDLYVPSAAVADAPWRRLTVDGLSKSPSVSPDGQRIAYVAQRQLFSTNHIYHVDARDGEPVRVTRTEGYYGTPRWSPDGTRLAFTAWNGDDTDVFIANADGSGLVNVTRHPSYDADPSWSPDGKRLAYVSSRDNSPGNFRVNVFLVDVDGRNVTRLTSLADYSAGPAWSPDGRQIVFSWASALRVMNADGSGLLRLTTPPPDTWDRAPTWRR